MSAQDEGPMKVSENTAGGHACMYIDDNYLAM